MDTQSTIRGSSDNYRWIHTSGYPTIIVSRLTQRSSSALRVLYLVKVSNTGEKEGKPARGEKKTVFLFPPCGVLYLVEVSNTGEKKQQPARGEEKHVCSFPPCGVLYQGKVSNTPPCGNF